MAVTVESSGTQTATVGTEHTLATLTTAKTFVLVVDMNALANGDTVELRCYRNVLAAGTEYVAYIGTYSNIQSDPIKLSIPLLSTQSCHFTLKQTAGTGRAFPWSVESI